MAFYEQEFIEIKREKAKMEIIGTMKCSVEQEDVRRYLASRKPKEKRRIGAFGALTVLVWLLAALPAVGELFLTNSPNPRLGGGTLVLTVIFALIAIICTLGYVRIASASRQTIAQTDPDSPEQLRAAAPDAVVWKQNRQWELCHAHDLVPLESALQGRPVFLGSQRPTDATTRSLRQFEEKKLVEYAASLKQSRAKAAAPASNAPLLVYLDIDRLGGGFYGLAAGQAVARVLSVADMESIAISSGDSAATLAGSANEYVIGLSGEASQLDRIEARLRSDAALGELLSRTGIRRGNANEPLVADGMVREGELINPPGHGTSFCAAGFKDIWKKQK